MADQMNRKLSLKMFLIMKLIQRLKLHLRLKTQCQTQTLFQSQLSQIPDTCQLQEGISLLRCPTIDLNQGLMTTELVILLISLLI